jgi:CBS domain-containing protein
VISIAGVRGRAPVFINSKLKFNIMFDTSIPVADIMTKEPVFVKPETPIDKIHHLFEAHNFHHIPVMAHGRLVGIISKTDYLKIRHMLATTWSGETICQDMYTEMTAEDIMSANPLTVESADTIGLAADIFKANTLHALPVVDDGELVGIVTTHDLITYAF